MAYMAIQSDQKCYYCDLKTCEREIVGDENLDTSALVSAAFGECFADIEGNFAAVSLVKKQDSLVDSFHSGAGARREHLRLVAEPVVDNDDLQPVVAATTRDVKMPLAVDAAQAVLDGVFDRDLYKH